MPSRRRLKVSGIVIFIAVVTLLFYTASQRQQQEADERTVGDFYYKTKNALENQKSNTNGVKVTEDEDIAKKMSDRLKEAAQVAKDNANAKAPKPDPPSSVVGVGSSAEGTSRDEKAVGGRKKGGSDVQIPAEGETQEDVEVEAEFYSILKKSPIIIFSKSYCPHSKRAKDILLGKYIIIPKPFVVELDQHPLGLNLQGRLAELTGRRTVPNVLVDGVSIGGGDDVAELDSTKKLAAKIKELGGKRMLEVQERPVEEEAHGL